MYGDNSTQETLTVYEDNSTQETLLCMETILHRRH